VKKNLNSKVLPRVTVDLVIFGLGRQGLSLLVCQRQDPPFVGSWALPASAVDIEQDESLDHTAKRILKQRLNLHASYLEQVQTLGNQHRDTRGWSVTIVYYGLVSANQILMNSLQPEKCFSWVTIEQVKSLHLAFDHQQLFESCLQRFQSKSLYTSLPIFLLEEEFTLTEVQKVYEAVLGIKMEKKSFRRRLLEGHFLEETGNIRRASHRPAQLYRLIEKQPYYFPRIIEGARHQSLS